jgi:hemerythrin-like domain-containing protein
MTDCATDLLKREHYLFARLLDGLEALVRSRKTPEDRLLAREMLRFFERSVDGLHQDKEERVLLTCLLARPARLRIPAMRRFSAHHRRDRRLLASLRADLAAFGEWDRHEDPFAHRASLYIRLQRRHMREENRHLFPLIQRVLRPEDDRGVRAGFRRLEVAHGRAFEPEAIALLGRLTVHLGEIPTSPATGLLDEGISRSLRTAL